MQFLRSQLAVAISIKALQRLAGIGDFAGIDHPVMIGVEGTDDRRRRAMSRAARAFRSAWPALRGTEFLSEEQGRRAKHGEYDEGFQ